MRQPFWSDTFDLDLLKVVPGVEELLGEHADVTLYTTGSTSLGRINHPTAWNHQFGLVAFFGFEDDARPEGYWTDAPVVELTFLELLRCSWVQSWVPIIEGARFPAIGHWPDFQALMWHVRGWDELEADALASLEQRIQGAISLSCDLLDRVRARAEIGARDNHQLSGVAE